jgi:hypothetical protein
MQFHYIYSDIICYSPHLIGKLHGQSLKFVCAKYSQTLNNLGAFNKVGTSPICHRVLLKQEETYTPEQDQCKDNFIP